MLKLMSNRGKLKLMTNVPAEPFAEPFTDHFSSSLEVLLIFAKA